MASVVFVLTDALLDIARPPVLPGRQTAAILTGKVRASGSVSGRPRPTATLRGAR